MPAPKGSKNKEKFKTKQSRRELCNKWCEHLSNGLSKESFPYCDPQTFRRYLKLYPKDFDIEAIEQAERCNLLYWEKQGIDGMWGGKAFNPTAWIFNMKNRFKWKDNVDVTSDGKRLDTIHGLLAQLNSGSDSTAEQTD